MATSNADKEQQANGSSQPPPAEDFRLQLTRASGRLLDSLVERFAEGRWGRLRSTLLLPVLTALALALLLQPGDVLQGTVLKAGDVAPGDVKASRDYLVEDVAQSEERRVEAERRAPYVYTFEPRAAQQVRERFTQTFAVLAKPRAELAAGGVRSAVAAVFGFEVSDSELQALQQLRGDRVLQQDLGHLLDRLYSRRLVSDRRLLAADQAHGIILLNQASGQEERLGGGEAVQELEEARRQVRQSSLGGGRGTASVLRNLLAKSLQADLIFNREATDQRKQAARAAANPVLLQVKRGEMLVREGERVSEQQAAKLRVVSGGGQALDRLARMAGSFGLVLIFLYFPFRFARKNIRKFNPTSKDLLFLSFALVSYFLLLRVCLFIITGLHASVSATLAEDLPFLLPFAIGAMLVRIVLNSEVALVYTLVCAPLIGLMFSGSLPVLIYGLLGAVVGAHGVRQCKDSTTIYAAGLKVSVANLAMVLALQALDGQFFTIETLYVACFALLSGLFTAICVAGLVPLVEGLFHYTTDIKLLELANLNSPVLRDLMVRAPGTYHHSVVVGNLVEAAAEAINANPLLARVAAYYHDIGKISKPQYFIENVGGGENRHDKLSPHMSALILISHVKEGAELARSYRLGEPLVNIIRQSHGTALITFFYEKAKTQAEADGGVVDEHEFRYPGPKPQTREAGLVMLADAVEAASRTLHDPTPARIQGLVQKIINKFFADGQLDECELTLKNLHEIAKSFNRILAGIYHHRIDYPEPAYKVAGGKKASEHNDREPPAPPAPGQPPAKKGGSDNIKRLGMSG